MDSMKLFKSMKSMGQKRLNLRFFIFLLIGTGMFWYSLYRDSIIHEPGALHLNSWILLAAGILITFMFIAAGLIIGGIINICRDYFAKRSFANSLVTIILGLCYIIALAAPALV